MNNILFESFKRVNELHFKNEYALIIPRFTAFFSNYEADCNTPQGLGKIVSSYYHCMKFLQIVISYDNVHKVQARTDITGSRELVYDRYINDYFNKNLMSNFILLKKSHIHDPDNYSINQYDEFITRLTQEGKAREYIEQAFNNILEFLKVWQEELQTNLLDSYYKKLDEQCTFMYKTQSARTLLSALLAIYEYCGDLEWAVSLNKDNTIKAFADFTGIQTDKFISDLAQEAFFTGLLVSDKYRNYFSLRDLLKENFNTSFLEAIFSANPKEYLLNKLLEIVPQSNLSADLFAYLKTDLQAIEGSLNTQEGFKILIHGVAGAGKTEFSKLIAATTGKKLYRLKMEKMMLPQAGVTEIAQKLNMLLSVSSLFDSKDYLLLFDECEDIFEQDTKYKEQINYTLENFRVPCVFIANEIKNFHPAYLRRFHYHINMDVCDYEQKLLITTRYLAGENVQASVIDYIAAQSLTNADIADNVKFYKATRNIDFLRQKIENRQITNEMVNQGVVEKSLYSILYPETNRYDFDAIIGYKDEKKELLSVKHYLDNRDKYLAANVKVSRGFILHGAPGTGKTSMVKALARKCNLPIVSVATGLLENDAQGALNIKKLFNIAKKNAPCAILLDEFEKMAVDRRIEMMNGSNQSLMNQLLIEMDDIYQNGIDVFVYATCNTTEFIDPAIVRSGRFKDMIEIGLPNKMIREAMFKSLLEKSNMPQGLKNIVKHTTGFSFLDIQTLINNYKVALLRATGKVSKQSLLMKEIYNFILGKTSSSNLLQDEKKIVAYHESGHAFMAYLFDKNVGNVSILPKSNYLGVTMMLQDEKKHVQTREDIEQEVMILMAGRVSEKVFLKQETTGSGDDFNKATNLVMRNINVLDPDTMGLMQVDMNDYQEKFSETYKTKVETSVNKVLQALYEKTKNLILNSQEEIHSMVNGLMEKEELIQNEMEGILVSAMSAKNTTKMNKLMFLKDK